MLLTRFIVAEPLYPNYSHPEYKPDTFIGAIVTPVCTRLATSKHSSRYKDRKEYYYLTKADC
jgi:hypothetical protein